MKRFSFVLMLVLCGTAVAQIKAQHLVPAPTAPIKTAVQKSDDKKTTPTTPANSVDPDQQAVTPPSDQNAEDMPPPMDQQPAVPPSVSYNSGKVTVVASNSDLYETVKAVTAASGIRLVRNGAASVNERIIVQIGPAIPREVLLALLTGSRYDFVMMGADGDADKVDRIVLTPKTAPLTTVGGPSADTALGGNQPPPRSVTVPDDDESDGFAAPPQRQPNVPSASQPNAQPNGRPNINPKNNQPNNLPNNQQGNPPTNPRRPPPANSPK